MRSIFVRVEPTVRLVTDASDIIVPKERLSHQGRTEVVRRLGVPQMCGARKGVATEKWSVAENGNTAAARQEARPLSLGRS